MASRGWLVLVALAIFLIFMALVLPRQAADAKAWTAGAPQPDTSLFYSAADLYAMAEAFGPEGRQAYIRARFTFDLIWPLVYGLFLVTAISWLASRAFAETGPARQLNLLPVAAVALDYLENVATAVVMARYPAPTPIVSDLAPLFTLVKWILVTGSGLALLAVGGAALWSSIRRGGRPPGR